MLIYRFVRYGILDIRIACPFPSPQQGDADEYFFSRGFLEKFLPFLCRYNHFGTLACVEDVRRLPCANFRLEGIRVLPDPEIGRCNIQRECDSRIIGIYTGNAVRAGIRFAALGGACLQAPAENRDKKDIDCFHVFTY